MHVCIFSLNTFPLLLLSQQSSIAMWTTLIFKSWWWLLKPKRSTSTLHYNKFPYLDYVFPLSSYILNTLFINTFSRYIFKRILHTVKWFHLFLSNTNNSIYYKSFVCTQFNVFRYNYLTLKIQFNIIWWWGSINNWSLTIRLFCVIFMILIGEVLPLCRDTVGVFYRPSWQGNLDQKLTLCTYQILEYMYQIFGPVNWSCRIHRLYLCRGVRLHQRVSWIWS